MAQPGPSGLSQRRRGGGGGGGATSHLDLDDPSSSRPSSPLASPALKHRNTNNGGAGASTSGSVDSAPTGGTSGGHRIAYDPRDLPNTAEEARLPRLTLMEEVLLLGLKDRQGYLSFWNDSISYSLRGAILAELLLRKRLRVVRDAARGRVDVQDRLVEVVEDGPGGGGTGGKKVKMTGEVLLDEALKMIKGSDEKRSVAEWIDLLSGETWNLSKIGYQLKQVRERLAKGLVDKGVLRTEKRNFLLFDMATHPIADATAKRHVVRRVTTLVCGSGTSSSSSAAHLGSNLYADESDDVSYASLRSLVLVCCAFAANVLDNALVHLSYEGRECAFQKVEDWLEVFGTWPMAQGVPNSGGAIGAGAGVGGGSAAGVNGASSYSSSAAARAARGGGGDGARIAEGSVLPDQREDAFGLGGASSSASNGPSAGGSGGGAGGGGSNSSSYSAAAEAMGISTADLVRQIRTNEAQEAGDEMLEGIAGVLAVLARMDSLL